MHNDDLYKITTDVVDSTTIWLFDSDGVLFVKDGPIMGAIKTLGLLLLAGKDIRIVTNNPSIQRESLRDDILSSLTKFVIVCDDKLKYLEDFIEFDDFINLDTILTPNENIPDQLEKIRHEKKRRLSVFLIGKAPTKETISQLDYVDLRDLTYFENAMKSGEPYDNADAVIIGFPDEYRGKELDLAALMVHRGSSLITTSLDLKYPLPPEGRKNAFRIGPGSIAFCIADTAGRERKEIQVLGKPEKSLYDRALLQSFIFPNQVVCVGDNLKTDILGAIARTDANSNAEDYGFFYIYEIQGPGPDNDLEGLEKVVYNISGLSDVDKNRFMDSLKRAAKNMDSYMPDGVETNLLESSKTEQEINSLNKFLGNLTKGLTYLSEIKMLNSVNIKQLDNQLSYTAEKDFIKCISLSNEQLRKLLNCTIDELWSLVHSHCKVELMMPTLYNRFGEALEKIFKESETILSGHPVIYSPEDKEILFYYRNNAPLFGCFDVFGVETILKDSSYILSEAKGNKIPLGIRCVFSPRQQKVFKDTIYLLPLSKKSVKLSAESSGYIWVPIDKIEHLNPMHAALKRIILDKIDMIKQEGEKCD